MIITVWIQNSDKVYNNNLSSYFYVLMAIMLFTPNDLSFKHGSHEVWEFGKSLEKNSSQYNNSVIMFVDNPDDILFQIAPFFIKNPSVTLMNGNEMYSYVMKWFIPNNEDIQNNADKFDKPVYIFAGQFTDLPQYQLIEDNYQGRIKIYKVK